MALLNLSGVSATNSIQNTSGNIFLNSTHSTAGNITSQQSTVNTTNSSAVNKTGQQLKVAVATNTSASNIVNQDSQSQSVKNAVSNGVYGSSSVTFTTAQILNASARVKAYTEANNGLPKYVTIGTTQVSMAQFLQLMTTDLLQINNKTTTKSIQLTNVSNPTKPVDNVKTGNINKTEYLNMAQNINTFINTNKTAPNYVKSSFGNIQFESAVYMYSRIMNFYLVNGTLPNYATIYPWTTVTNKTTDTSTIPAALQEYLQATANCQSNNAQIIALSKSIISNAGATTTYSKAAAIFNWVRDNIGYSYYYNTQYGAVGTLNAKTGNCCDTSHLLIALERAAGIPARYVHGYCDFSDGWYGHVWAQVYVDGTWYTADAISSRNTFGVVNNWNTATATIYGTYLTLPF